MPPVFVWSPPPAAAITPCVGVCVLDAQGLCEGCLRSGEEIAAWSTLSNAERRRFIDEVLPQREAARGQ